MSRDFMAFFLQPTASHVFKWKKVLFVIGFQSLVLLNYTYMMLFVSNRLSYVINYIWFINIILNIMHFFQR